MEVMPVKISMSKNGVIKSELTKRTSPYVRNDFCINCGTCISVCPTQAISEVQRQICRLCPDCADSDVMFPRDMEELTKESCAYACPVGHYPEGYVNMLAKGNIESAWSMINAVNPMPSILGRICSRPCEEACKRGKLIDSPIPIRAFKRLISDIAHERGWEKREKYPRKYDERIAVIGAGPAGMAAAHYLSSMGYEVTVLDNCSEPGGMLRKAVPEFRLPEEIINRDLELILERGVRFIPNVEVGKNPSLENLLREDFDAVIIAIGASNGAKLQIPGSDFMNVHTAVDFLTSVKAGYPLEIGERLAVIGGGSVATDTARTALRLGAKEAHILCIESKCEMPAYSWEVEEAESEGVSFINSSSPILIGGKWQKAEWLECETVKSFSIGESGISCETCSESRSKMDFDSVVFAVGQISDISTFIENSKLEHDGKNFLSFDKDSKMTNIRGVFLAGDIESQKGSVVEALSSARKAADSIDAYLRGKIKTQNEQAPKGAPLKEKVFPVMLEKLKAANRPLLEPEEALKGFMEVEQSYKTDIAAEDALRCVKCGYVEVDHDKCIGCGACSSVCPSGDVIRMEKPVS